MKLLIHAYFIPPFYKVTARINLLLSLVFLLLFTKNTLLYAVELKPVPPQEVVSSSEINEDIKPEKSVIAEVNVEKPKQPEEIKKEGQQETVISQSEADDVKNNIKTLMKTKKCRYCLLKGANLYRFNLTGVDLEGANLDGARLTRAELNNTNLKNAILSNAKLFRASMFKANLEGADLSKANLKWCSLYKANLKGANLKGASLYRANAYGADFTGAKLQDIKYYQANTEGTIGFHEALNAAKKTTESPLK